MKWIDAFVFLGVLFYIVSDWFDERRQDTRIARLEATVKTLAELELSRLENKE